MESSSICDHTPAKPDLGLMSCVTLRRLGIKNVAALGRHRDRRACGQHWKQLSAHG
eukprot:CAMPEP_0202107936 /NCGR_PEP_ID=MMETSP0965-20130614/18680_1 /ASSEMBLY_ACC=CAM_ASM_000507 /TAXON_ID=4773 /ORGANISM="Schizochytrium aggregatum, Strain ATCC28209" /LENGTH=55 /DNA_ID=CAMNT_0048677133 /DNA_START=222 /DNA_END=386 /DNA_ORIENTATION=+